MHPHDPQAAIDLHTHSTASDGTFAPAAVVRAAVDAGLAALALTDHDTVAGLAEASAEAARLGLEFIPGAELAVRWQYGTMDILGLWLPLEAPAVTRTLAWLNAERLARNVRIVEKLASLGLPLTYADVERLAEGTVGRPHIAQVLVAKGYATSVQEAFDRFLSSKGLAYVPKTVLDPDKAVDILKAEGATVLLAHPFLYRLDNATLEKAVLALKDMGIDGIEAYYTEHTPSQTTTCLSWAKRYDLVVSGGSDFHGAVKPDIRLGCGKGRLHVPYAVLQTLKDHRASQGLPV